MYNNYYVCVIMMCVYAGKYMVVYSSVVDVCVCVFGMTFFSLGPQISSLCSFDLYTNRNLAGSRYN